VQYLRANGWGSAINGSCAHVDGLRWRRHGKSPIDAARREAQNKMRSEQDTCSGFDRWPYWPTGSPAALTPKVAWAFAKRCGPAEWQGLVAVTLDHLAANNYG